MEILNQQTLKHMFVKIYTSCWCLQKLEVKGRKASPFMAGKRSVGFKQGWFLSY